MSLPLLTQIKQILSASRLSINKSILTLLEALQVELDSKSPSLYQASIAPEQWQPGGKGYSVEIANQAITEKDLAVVLIDDQSLTPAADAGVSSVCETQKGKLILSAQSKPGQEISLSYWIEEGRGLDG